MSRKDEWNEFIRSMVIKSYDDYHKTQEYEYIQRYQDEIDSALKTLLTPSEKSAVDEYIFELQLITEREGDMLYIQGMRDAMFILNQLGVLKI